MLIEYESEAGRFELVRKHARRSSSDINIFTVIVGRNGTGKSRLLRGIVARLVYGVVDRKAFARDGQGSLRQDALGYLKADSTPSEVICVSTSPFDKFPLLRREQFPEGYSYLGLRGLSSSNLGLAYMSRIVFALIDSIRQDSKRAYAINGVLEHLGYEGVIHVTLQKPPTGFSQRVLKSINPQHAFSDYVRRSIFAGDGLAQLRQTLEANPSQFDRVIEIANRVVPHLEGVTFPRITIGPHGVETPLPPEVDQDAYIQLVLSGFFRLKEVTLQKREMSREIKLQEASSGEQAVVMALLGIGSKIKDGAVICIDEPEVCLHPEWQEKYVELLHRTFRHYKGCHFIVATHSPQIVAQMPHNNCFVVSMEDRITRSARDYAGRSIDFQLAEVFGAPGHRNEYLTRIALNAFARMSKHQEVDSESKQTLHTLGRLSSSLHSDDPLHDLINALQEMARTYG